ncbi:dTDP-4-dehydrorhamnose reductase [Salinarimonas sp.]|uniref:dTDP-4-dehydrorhamnose reductase n=1 Tax=Salinarimonas sp. TaxID=2766526 RepID=UPI0032D8D8D2
MRVLLLGANGQLGSDLRRAHEASGARFDLVPIGRDTLDVAVPGDVDRVLKDRDFDALVNCTSYHKTDEVELNGGLAMAVNAHAVDALARICAAKGARFVHFSSDYVFGGDVLHRRPYREDDPTSPVNVYGASKALGETFAQLACPNAIVVRVASLFGVNGASGKGGNFVETIIRVAREKGRLKVVDDQVMSPTATADVAEMVLRMLTQGCPGGVYHVVGSGSASWYAFAREIVRLVNIPADVEACESRDFPTVAMRPAYSVLDGSKISSRFGAMPRWEDALERYLHAKGHRSGTREPAGCRAPDNEAFALRYDLMTTDQVPARTMSEWLLETEFDKYVRTRRRM